MFQSPSSGIAKRSAGADRGDRTSVTRNLFVDLPSGLIRQYSLGRNVERSTERNAVESD
jgi:hypothetical protein